MGRHSAPDDGDDLVEDDAAGSVQVAVVDRDLTVESVPFRPGRHSRPDESSGAPGTGSDDGPAETSDTGAPPAATDADAEEPTAGTEDAEVVDVEEDVAAGGVAPLALPSDATVRIAKVEVEAGPNDLLDTDPGTGDLDLVAQIAALDPGTEPALTRPLPESVDLGGEAVPVEGPAGPGTVAPDRPAAAAPASTADRSSKGDFALVRRHTDVLARCLAAVLVPIAAYVVVLAVLGSFGARTLLIWIWIPLISAGVLLGLFLDAGHKRYDATDNARAAAGAAVHEEPEALSASVDD